MSEETPKRCLDHSRDELVKLLSAKVVGQMQVFEHIVPFLEMHRAGLGPESKPIGVFLLLGPTGTGKTHTVEALAELLHGSKKKYLRVDCGEYQLDHEVARLIGAPPGYLGHRETKPVLSQEAVRSVSSSDCDISLVLFDEIEKAAPSLVRLLLGVLDKARLQMGDNTAVDFEPTMVFLTSNLGAREMMREITPSFGFEQGQGADAPGLAGKLEAIAVSAVRKRFPPEFVNRIDAVLTYQPLSDDTLARILELQIDELGRHVHSKLGNKGFDIEVSESAKGFLLKTGSSVEYGARELKRTVYKHLTQPLATLVAQNLVKPGSRVLAELAEDGAKLHISVPEAKPAASSQPTVLIVDDNKDLLNFLARLVQGSGWGIVRAESAVEARQLVAECSIDAALLDYMLPDDNGLTLGVELKERFPRLHVFLMTGATLSPDEEEICRARRFPLIRKPFLIEEILEPLRRRLKRQASAAASAT